ncbi:hypothetical protein Cpir12675_001625 [Ceratocystis pirilliformis]|uniref:CID domain-containing protein n=1 Tax=Ceratocystis pirilliformis TaxID=259994 RepID=A0ABR3ZE84_9PEZI
MSDNSKKDSNDTPPPHFPDAEAKIVKIITKSAFDKQKADAHAKRQREAAEAAAIYDEFVKSFDADEQQKKPEGLVSGSGSGVPRLAGSLKHNNPMATRPEHWPQDKPKGFANASNDGFKGRFGPTSASSTAPKSGPGSLGPVPVSFSSKKRPLEGSASSRAKLGFEDYTTTTTTNTLTTNTLAPTKTATNNTPASTHKGLKPLAKVFNTSDDEGDTPSPHRDEVPISRPTIRLAQLPPATSLAFVRKLIPSTLVVEDVQLVPATSAAGSASTERKSTVAIVTLAQDTPATQIDTVVSELQNKYLGFGFYLSLHRHLSSSSVASSLVSSGATAIGSSGISTQPFGAKKIHRNSGAHRGSRGFAPPTSYWPSSSADGHSQQGLFHVPVKPPSDIRIVRTINKVLEQVLEFGPEFEALLMSRPEVKREERWAWLWDARSVGGIWYRWKLWEIVTSSSSAALRDNGRNGNRFVPLFDGGHAWKVPKHGLPYEYATQIDEFVSDPEYNSDSDSDACGLDRERDRHGDREQTFLNPLEKARLIHLLARLPSATTGLQKGDVARVTAFAITHANRGAAEVVQMVVTNIRKPLALMGAARKYPSHSLGNDGEGNYKPSDFSAEGNDRLSDSTKDKNQIRDKGIVGSSAGSDTSSASLVGLYIVSDILSAASNSNVRHAWRFRQLFEVALRESHVFAELGELAAKFCWGRLRADRWKRSIGAVLSLWEGWCVFQAETQAELVRTFEEAMDGGRDADGGADEEADGYKGAGAEGRSRWKSMENLRASTEARPEPLPVSNLDTQDTMEADGEDEDGADVEGEPMEESDVEGEPIGDIDSDGEDVEGEPMLDDVEGEPIDEDSD